MRCYTACGKKQEGKTMTFETDNNFESGVVIRVIGVGGG